MRRLSAIRGGSLRLVDALGTADFGEGEADPVEIRMDDLRAYTALATKGTLGAAAAFIDGWWNCDDLTGLFRLLTKNADAMSALDRSFSRLFTRTSAWLHRLRRNTVDGSRVNIHAHYD